MGNKRELVLPCVSVMSQLCAQRGAWLRGRGICHILQREGSYFCFHLQLQCWAASMITSYQENKITLIITASSRWKMNNEALHQRLYKEISNESRSGVFPPPSLRCIAWIWERCFHLQCWATFMITSYQEKMIGFIEKSAMKACLAWIWERCRPMNGRVTRLRLERCCTRRRQRRNQ